jgi:hypothetical protein
MPTGKKSRTYLALAIGAFVLVLVLAYLFMFVEFSGVEEAGPAGETSAGETER